MLLKEKHAHTHLGCLFAHALQHRDFPLAPLPLEASSDLSGQPLDAGRQLAWVVRPSKETDGKLEATSQSLSFLLLVLLGLLLA